MKRSCRMLALASAVVMLAAGCGARAPQPTQPTAAAPSATQQARSDTVTASAVVEPEQHAALSFLLTAPVKEVKVRTGEQVRAGQPLIVLDVPELEYGVAAAQAELQSAQANAILQHTARKEWNGSKFVYLSGPPELRQLSDARVTEAEAALAVATAQLAQATLVAPFDGTVVSVKAEPGEMVAPGQAVLEIGDLSRLQITTTDLSEREIAGVRVGQPVDAQLKAFGQPLKGAVVAIAARSQTLNGDTVFQVTIGLDQQPAGLLWGMTGDVSIQTK